MTTRSLVSWKMSAANGLSLWGYVEAALDRSDPRICGRAETIALRDLAAGSTLSLPAANLAGRSVVIKTNDQLTAAAAMLELDGIARRLVICPPDLSREHLRSVLATAGAEFLVTDETSDQAEAVGTGLADLTRMRCSAVVAPMRIDRQAIHATEWVLLTSGTTGAPKLVAHTLASLTGVIRPERRPGPSPFWSTLYDIRRYGGLQILLRALLGGASMLLSSGQETVADFLERAGRAGVTHISGTPSHWRRVLMCPQANLLRPAYIRLSGEIADQAVLDQLKAAYPSAAIGHAFASTEAGVGFAVDDGRAGFPASLIENCPNGIALKIHDGSLWIRSTLNASRYLGTEHLLAMDEAGFIDTGDLVERHGDRYHFVGRKGGIINVGGLKVHPEEVEAIINRHPLVRMSLVRARKSPFTGALVAAEIVLQEDLGAQTGPEGHEALKADIQHWCRAALAAHKVPAVIRIVSQLELGASGKLARRNG